MVKHDSIVEKAQLDIWKVKVVAGFLWEFFPVANCVIRYVTDPAADKSEFAVGNCFILYEVFDYLEGVVGFFFGGFSGLLIVNFCFAVFYFKG